MTLEELYRSMSSAELQTFRQALQLDMMTSGDVTFCQLRITVITRILDERERAPDEDDREEPEHDT